MTAWPEKSWEKAEKIPYCPYGVSQTLLMVLDDHIERGFYRDTIGGILCGYYTFDSMLPVFVKWWCYEVDILKELGEDE